MELLMAIALLCQNSGGITKRSTDSYQLKCQQEYLECYLNMDKGTIRSGPALSEEIYQKKFLYQCVLERQVKSVQIEK